MNDQNKRKYNYVITSEDPGGDGYVYAADARAAFDFISWFVYCLGFTLTSSDVIILEAEGQ